MSDIILSIVRSLKNHTKDFIKTIKTNGNGNGNKPNCTSSVGLSQMCSATPQPAVSFYTFNTFRT